MNTSVAYSCVLIAERHVDKRPSVAAMTHTDRGFLQTPSHPGEGPVAAGTTQHQSQGTRGGGDGRHQRALSTA